MNIEKIAIDGGYVWVDKDAQRIGFYVIDKHGVIYKQETDKDFNEFTGSKRIIAASPELKLEGVPIYVEWLSEQFLIDVGFKVHKDLERDGWLKIGFIKGYQAKEKELSDELLTKYQEGMKKGLELSKELFTEDDVRKAIVMSATSPTDNLIDRCDEIIEHIKQSKK